eukprot:CAMPEP_0116899218 /NCGR_PEP_ID=MMETSP0467-20121206/7841_1 /TAXON_ID=283647 /ORGANISM="Mesodinium pulex, Strain SPMC105" /LENGTH=48 /DNA_ID= /DNA_START= /DNA_END= /DNA_ORIENTATION=
MTIEKKLKWIEHRSELDKMKNGIFLQIKKVDIKQFEPVAQKVIQIAPN